MGGVNLASYWNWGRIAALLLNDLVLGREKIRNSPCDNIQNSFAVRKQ